MKKVLLFSAVLGIVSMFNINQGAFATPKVITGNLGSVKTIVYTTGNVTSNISLRCQAVLI